MFGVFVDVYVIVKLDFVDVGALDQQESSRNYRRGCKRITREGATKCQCR